MKALYVIAFGGLAGGLLGLVPRWSDGIGTSLIAGASIIVASLETQITAQIVVFSLAIAVIRLYPRGLAGSRR